MWPVCIFAHYFAHGFSFSVLFPLNFVCARSLATGLSLVVPNERRLLDEVIRVIFILIRIQSHRVAAFLVFCMLAQLFYPRYTDIMFADGCENAVDTK